MAVLFSHLFSCNCCSQKECTFSTTHTQWHAHVCNVYIYILYIYIYMTSISHINPSLTQLFFQSLQSSSSCFSLSFSFSSLSFCCCVRLCDASKASFLRRSSSTFARCWKSSGSLWYLRGSNSQVAWAYPCMSLSYIFYLFLIYVWICRGV